MGSTKVPVGDEQMVGGAFAIWNDMIDNAENGMSEYDIYKRTIRAAGMMGTNLWGKGSITQTEASAIIDQYPEVPGTNFNYNVNKSENGAITSVDMESTTDTTGPTNSLTAGNDVLKEAAGRKVLDLSSGKTATFEYAENSWSFQHAARESKTYERVPKMSRFCLNRHTERSKRFRKKPEKSASRVKTTITPSTTNCRSAYGPNLNSATNSKSSLCM